MLENGLSIDLTEIEQFIRGQGLGESVSFQNLVERLMAGDLTGLCSQLLFGLRSALFQEIGSGGRILGQILALGIFAAVFTSFSGLFQESQVSETGFFAAYLLLFTLLMTGLTQSIQVAAKAAGAIMQFMKAMMPAYFLAVALAGGSISAAAMYEFTMGLAGVSQWLLITVMIPLIRLELLMKMTGNMVKEEILSRLNDLLDQVIRWGMKVLLGVVVGFHVVQGLLLPYADSLKNGAAQKLVGMIPGIGQGAAAAAQMIVGSGVLLKNAVGMAGAVVVFLILAVPMLKLLVLMLFYQCAAAILEPICDKRIISCISAAARGHQLLLQIVLTAALLFLITVSLVCAVLGEHIDAVAVSYAEVANYVESGDLKVLAVMNDKRLDSIPDVPTCQEAGYNVVLGTWRGLGVPKDTPDEVVDQLYEIFSQAAQSDAFVDFMNKSNNVIDVLDGATFEERIKSDLETYTALVTDLGLKVQ